MYVDIIAIYDYRIYSITYGTQEQYIQLFYYVHVHALSFRPLQYYVLRVAISSLRIM
jgi:hypothetical protein